MHWYFCQRSNHVPLLWWQNHVITFIKVKRLQPQIGINAGKSNLFIPFYSLLSIFTLCNTAIFIVVNCTPDMFQRWNWVPLLSRQNQVITFMKVKDSIHRLAKIEVSLICLFLLFTIIIFLHYTILQFIFVNCTPVMHWYLLQWSNRVPLLWRQNQVITFMKVKDSSHGLA